jgi:hypothetical protein
MAKIRKNATQDNNKKKKKLKKKQRVYYTVGPLAYSIMVEW